MPRKSSDVVDIPAGIPPEVVKRIAQDVSETRAARRPLCPMCGRRPQETAEGFCFPCSRDRHERDKDRKRRWWSKHADAKRMAARTLEQIASDIHESYDVGKEGYEQALDAYLAIGRDLLQARDDMPANQDFGRWFRAQHFPFKRRWAHVLRQAAEHEEEIRASLGTQVPDEGFNLKRLVASVTSPEPEHDQSACTDPTCRHCPIHCGVSA